MRDRRKVLLSKIETTKGVDAAPTPGDNAIKIENLKVRPQGDKIETNEHSSGLDKSAPIVAGMRCEITFDTLFKGSGSAEIPPEVDPLWRACGWAVQINASAIPAAPEAATSGTTSSITLGAGATGTADLYRFMPIVLTGAPSAVLGAHMITGYTAGKLATIEQTLPTAITVGTSWQIPPHVLYLPTSGEAESVTHWVYEDGNLYKVTGSAGNVSGSIDAGGIGRLSWRFSGFVAAKIASPIPTGLSYQKTRPPVWRGGVLAYDGVVGKVSKLTFDCQNNIVLGRDPNKPEGYDYPDLVDRDIMATIDPEEVVVGGQNLFQMYRDGTIGRLVGIVGAVAGNRYGLVGPEAMPTGYDDAARDGKMARNLPMDLGGDDSALGVCYF